LAINANTGKTVDVGTAKSYINEIESKGDNVSVIGVTDYYTISGYEKKLNYKLAGRL